VSNAGKFKEIRSTRRN